MSPRCVFFSFPPPTKLFMSTMYYYLHTTIPALRHHPHWSHSLTTRPAATTGLEMGHHGCLELPSTFFLHSFFLLIGVLHFLVSTSTITTTITTHHMRQQQKPDESGWQGAQTTFCRLVVVWALGKPYFFVFFIYWLMIYLIFRIYQVLIWWSQPRMHQIKAQDTSNDVSWATCKSFFRSIIL